MRVPPDLVGRRPAWHLPAALIVLTMAVLVAGISVSTDENRAVATQSNRITKLQVVFTRYPLIPGKVITAADLILQFRPIESLPEGAITRPEEIIGKVSQAIMPEGAVVTLGSFVGEKA